MCQKSRSLTLSQVKRRADGKTRLFGFVTFTSAEAAEQVVQHHKDCEIFYVVLLARFLQCLPTSLMGKQLK